MNTEYVVDGQRFEWDEDKAKSNIIDHDGATFFEAASVFTDEHFLLLDDDAHSDGERRYIVLGRSDKGRVLFVSYTEREQGNVIHIISAREAEDDESEEYFERPI